MIESILKKANSFITRRQPLDSFNLFLPFSLMVLFFGISILFLSCNTPSKERTTETASTLYVSRIQGKIHFRADDRVFSEDRVGEINLGAKRWVPSHKEPWTTLLDFGSDNVSSARLFSFRSFPKSDQVLFVIQTSPQYLKGYTATFPSYVLFRYSESSDNQKPALLLAFSRPLKGGPYVAKIDRYSPDEKHVSLNLYTCWSCAGVHPNKVLLDLETLVVKDIGKVSYFKWNAESQYEYKDYIERDCFVGDTGVHYKCPEDPSKLPLKRGTFDIETVIVN